MAHVLMLFNQHNTSGIDPVPNIQCISANEIEDDHGDVSNSILMHGLPE